MSLDAIFYPHFLQLTTSKQVVRFDTVDSERQYRMTARMGGGDPFPCFVGPQSSDPQIRFTTPSIWSVFNAIVSAQGMNVVEDLSAQDVILYYRAGKPQSFRELTTASLNLSETLQECAMLSWESLSAREDEDATISCMLKTARKDTATDPWVCAKNVTVPQTLCESLYSLGPIIYNGRLIGSIHSVDWSNNLTPYTRRTSLSPRDPDYQGIHNMTPVITCRTNDLKEMAAATDPEGDAYGGRAMNELRIYLRKRTSPGFFVADSTAEHIELVCYGGWKGATGTTGIEPSELSIEYHLAAITDTSGRVAQDALFVKNLAAKIPQDSTLPADGIYSNDSVANNTPIFIVPDLGGGGIPTSYAITLNNLPAGAELNTSNGAIVGVVSDAPGAYPVTIQASNGTGSNTGDAITITVT